MKKTLISAVLIFYCSLVYSVPVELKNIVAIDGIQDNPLLGYGIVVGLKGTGDSENGSQTREILSRIANNFGFKLSPDKLKPKNSAVVLVSATLSPFSQPGSRLDVKVSSVFDAKSLEGGELILTPLIAGENNIYAIAQGPLMTEKGMRGVYGTIPRGAIVQKSTEVSLYISNNIISISILESLGLQALVKVADTIKKKYPDSIKSVNNNRLQVEIPTGMEPYPFISELLSLKADIPEEPSVLIDSKSGIIISGGNVTISPAAVTFGGTKLNIGNQQPAASWGQSKTSGNEAVKYYKGTATVQELVDGLNQIGITGQEISKILELLYKNGNLKARLILQ